MKSAHYLIALTAGLLCLGACKEKEKVTPVTPDTEKPVIAPTEPAGTGAVVLHSGNILQVAGTVTDNVVVQEIHVELNNEATQAELYHQHIPGTTKSENYSKQIPLPAVQDTLNLVLSIGAEDREGNYAEVQRDVTVIP